MYRKKQIYQLLGFVLILLVASNQGFAQCSMCRAVLESDADQSTAEGINNGILFLMAFPYLLIGGLGYYIYKNYSSKS